MKNPPPLFNFFAGHKIRFKNLPPIPPPCTLKCFVVLLSTLEEDCKGEEASSFKVE
jgi:hypothetical protein